MSLRKRLTISRERKEREHRRPLPCRMMSIRLTPQPGSALVVIFLGSCGAIATAYPSAQPHQALHPSGVCSHSTDGALTAVAHWSRVVCGMGRRSAK